MTYIYILKSVQLRQEISSHSRILSWKGSAGDLPKFEGIGGEAMAHE